MKSMQRTDVVAAAAAPGPSAVVAAAAPSGPSAEWAAAARVLAVRLDNLGDVLMTTPALAALRESLPQAHLTLLTSHSGAAAAAHLPMLDAVWAHDVPWMRNGRAAAAADAPGAAEQALVARLAAGRFDAVVIFTVCTQSALPMALLCRMAGIPRRLAFCRENPYALLTHWQPETDGSVEGGMRHEVQRQLDLVASVGLRTSDAGLRFTVRAADRDEAAAQLARVGLDPARPYVVLHPGATADSWRWPAPRFGVVAQAIAQQTGCQVVFAGGELDAVLVELARGAQTTASPSPSLAGRLGLGELAALIEGAQLLVANNSAPAHLAAAVGTPVVELYALTNPQHTPWQVPSRVLSQDVPCRWCLKSSCPQGHHECLRGVPARRGVAAARELLQPGLQPEVPSP